jgi:hypothetical protein
MSILVETAEEATKRRQTQAVARLTGSVLLLPLEAYLLMLLLGALHTTVAPVAAIGYGASVVVVLSVNLAAHFADKFRRAE